MCYPGPLANVCGHLLTGGITVGVAVPDTDEFVETIETVSGKGFLSPTWFLILTEGTCRKELNNPPCDFWDGCWGIGGGGGKS